MLITHETIISHSIADLDQSVFNRIREGELTLIHQSDRLAYDQKMQFTIYNSHKEPLVIFEFLIDADGYVCADYYDYIVKFTDKNIDVITAIMKLFNTDIPRVVISSDNGLPINDAQLYDGYVANKVPIKDYELIQGDIYLN